MKLFQDSNRDFLTQPEGHLLDIWANEVRSKIKDFTLQEQFFLPAVAEQLNWAKEQLRQVNDPVICIGLGGSEKEKRYPIHKWKQVIHRLNSEGFYLVLLGGDDCPDPGDSERGVSLVGKINITQSVALTNFSSLLISADTGIGHLAAAQGVRTISLFGSYTLPEKCRPYGDNNLTLITPSTTAPTMSAEAIVQHAIKVHEGAIIPERSVTLDSEDNNWINLTFSRFVRKKKQVILTAGMRSSWLAHHNKSIEEQTPP